MKIPSKIKLLGRQYTVSKERLPDGILGQTDQESRKISLSETLDAAHAFETFIHELTHVAMLETGVDNVIESGPKEAVCDCVALLFSDIFELRGDK